MKTHYIIGGGTIFHVRPHLALCAPAYGKTALSLQAILGKYLPDDKKLLRLTRMAGGNPDLETNADVSRLIDEIIADPSTGIVFMSAALCDFEGSILEETNGPPGAPLDRVTLSGKNQPRLKTKEGVQRMTLQPADKLIGRIRKERKDIFLVGFKTTTGATSQEQYEAGLTLLKKTSCNLVLANDLHTRLNMVVAPELARYHEAYDRFATVKGLVEMAVKRSQLHFTRTTLKDGVLIPWDSASVPPSLKTVVDHCIQRGAYKPFNGVTVGHFAYRDRSIGSVLYSSRRKQNYNLPHGTDLVRVEFQGEQVIAYGAKPSAGTRSQWAVLQSNPDYDCIIHFHCPARLGSAVIVRPQHDYECGSHECGENTKAGIRRYECGALAAVMLDRHGPNIIFHRDVDPQRIIDFIEDNFDLTKRSDEP
jgi:hypothetical protein